MWKYSKFSYVFLTCTRETERSQEICNLDMNFIINIFPGEDAKMQHSLKIEVEGLKTQTMELKKSLAEKTDEVEKSEAAFRSEVSLPVSGGSAPNLSSKQHKMGLVRYRSLRDHNGRFYLVVKIWWLYHISLHPSYSPFLSSESFLFTPRGELPPYTPLKFHISHNKINLVVCIPKSQGLLKIWVILELRKTLNPWWLILHPSYYQPLYQYPSPYPSVIGGGHYTPTPPTPQLVDDAL